MKKIYIRVDGNEIIATGHIMRCLSIAEQIRQLDAEAIFLAADERPCPLIEERGFSVEVLDTIWDDLNQETNTLCKYITEHHVEILLLDSYYVTKEYLQKIAKCTKIVYIDDLNSFLYPVHGLIHYWAFADEKAYRQPYQKAGMHPQFLVGGRYVPLREEFAYKSYEVQNQVRKVLITTGGTDQLNVAGDLLNRVIENAQLMELEYHVIVGCFNQNKEQLYRMADAYSNIYLHENVNNMSQWMRDCDIAISASGTTLYELCACGIPTVCLEVADNQKGATAWEENGYMIYAGNAYEDKEQCMQKCIKALLQYRDSLKLRQDKSVRMQSLVDGHGARRIAQYLIDGGLEDAE